jgi:hypothetical protein
LYFYIFLWHLWGAGSVFPRTDLAWSSHCIRISVSSWPFLFVSFAMAPYQPFLHLVLLVQVVDERVWGSGTFFPEINHVHSYLCQFAFVSRRVSFNGFVLTPSSFGIIGARRESAYMRQWDVFFSQIKPQIKHVHYLCQFSFVFRQVFFNELVLTFSPPNIIVARRQTACKQPVWGSGHCFPRTHPALAWATTHISVSSHPFLIGFFAMGAPQDPLHSIPLVQLVTRGYNAAMTMLSRVCCNSIAYEFIYIAYVNFLGSRSVHSILETFNPWGARSSHTHGFSGL